MTRAAQGSGTGRPGFGSRLCSLLTSISPPGARRRPPRRVVRRHASQESPAGRAWRCRAPEVSGRVVTSCTLPRLEQEIEELENTDALPTAAARGSVAAPSPAPGPAPSPAPEDQRAEAVPNSQQVRGSGAPPCWPRSRSTHRLWGCGCGRPTSQMRAHPSPATSQLRRLHALLGLPGPQFPRQTGASRVFKESVKNKRFMGRGSSPKTTCLSSFLGSPTQWASPVYLHTALSGGAASPFDEKDFGPKRLRDWLKATQWSSLY